MPSSLRRIVTALMMLGAALLPLTALPAGSAEPGDASATWQINLKEADIRELITQVANITGRTFVVDQRVKGKVTVISSASLNADEVYQLFLSVLRVHGFAAVQTGEVTKIVLQTVAKQSASPNDFSSGPPPTSEEIITRVIPAENVAATELVKILRPMIPQYGHIAAVARPNVVIISDHAENLARMLQIVERIDVADRDEIVVVPLKEAWVGDVAELLVQMVPQIGKGTQNANTPNAITMIANERNNSLVLKGKAGKIAEMMDLIGRLDQPATTGGSTQVIHLAHADAANVADIVKGILVGGEAGAQSKAGAPGAVTIQADEALNAIVVRADPGTMADIRELVAQLDVRRIQVLIEAAIVEVSLDDTATYGVDIAAVDRSGTVPVLTTPLAGTLGQILASLSDQSGDGSTVSEDAGLLSAAGGSTSPTFAVGKLDPNGFSFVTLVQALATSADADLLSTPSILTLDNEEAKIVVGQNVPFRTGSFTTNTSGSNNPFTTIQREDVGLTLTVTPHVHDGKVVRLEIQQEVSNVVNSAIGDSAFADIVTSQRTIETTILADDRQTIVLGGLIQDDINQSNNRVPLLGDIPGLGRLFRSERNTRTKRNLLVFLRPTVLRNDEEVAKVTAEKYSRVWEIGRRDGASAPPSNLDDIYDGNVPRPLERRKEDSRGRTKPLR